MIMSYVNGITIEQVRALVARGCERHPELRTRLERAAFIVTMRTVAQQPDGSWVVGADQPGQPEPHNWYVVKDGKCECADYRAPNRLCKHRLAVLMIQRARQEAQEAQQATVDGLWYATGMTAA